MLISIRENEGDNCIGLDNCIGFLDPHSARSLVLENGVLIMGWSESNVLVLYHS